MTTDRMVRSSFRLDYQRTMKRRTLSPAIGIFLVAATVLLMTACTVSAADENSLWIRPTSPKEPLIWGRKDGIIFGLQSEGGIPGPRGLIRVGIYNPKTGKSELINFIGVEPVVAGCGSRESRRGISEEEMSIVDPGVKGKRMWVQGSPGADQKKVIAGELTTNVNQITTLNVRINVEPFTNGCHVYVVASITSDHPDEIRFSVHNESDSSAIDELSLTGTMGNFERLRQLWLRGRVIDSRILYSGMPAKPFDFAFGPDYPLGDMLRTGEGDAIALCSTDEAEPASVQIPDVKFAPWWQYHSVKLTQYWRVPARDIQPNLRIYVNGRRVYWDTWNRVPGGKGITVPGGIAFENFEVRQRYMPGQVFIFGLTPKLPSEFKLGN